MLEMVLVFLCSQSKFYKPIFFDWHTNLNSSFDDEPYLLRWL
jgi:hypothetical protein